MMQSGIAHRYAKALFQAALEAGAADEVFADAQSLLTVTSEFPQVRKFLLSPQVPTEEKHALVTKVVGGRAHKLFVDFLHLLIDKKRIVIAKEVVETYRDIYEKHKGVLAVKAITAVPLDEPQRQKLVRTLEEKTRKTIRLKQTVNPDILGGMILIIDDKVIDGSVRHKLERLGRRLRETRVIRGGAASPGDGR